MCVARSGLHIRGELEEEEEVNGEWPLLTAHCCWLARLLSPHSGLLLCWRSSAAVPFGHHPISASLRISLSLSHLPVAIRPRDTALHAAVPSTVSLCAFSQAVVTVCASFSPFPSLSLRRPIGVFSLWLLFPSARHFFLTKSLSLSPKD